jgi:mono/diheme cytochrome c family protein
MVRISAVLLLCFTLAGLPVSGQAPPARGIPELKRFFQANCVRCHGQDGSAVSPEGQRLKGLDFTAPDAFKGTNDEALAATIRKGVFFGITMPGFKDQLTEGDALLMVRAIVRKSEKGRPIAPKGDAK